MADQALKQMINIQAKPILKWAGGKTQMLGDLLPKVPSSYGRYIEPFFWRWCNVFYTSTRTGYYFGQQP